MGVCWKPCTYIYMMYSALIVVLGLMRERDGSEKFNIFFALYTPCKKFVISRDLDIN